MNFVFETMNTVFKMMNCVLKMLNFVFKMMILNTNCPARREEGAQSWFVYRSIAFRGLFWCEFGVNLV